MAKASALGALFELPRPVNCAITCASVLLGGWLGAAALPRDLLLAALSAALITGGGNAFNDLCGLAEDRINKPQRPLPSGRLSVSLARAETLLLIAAGLALGLILPFPAPDIALFAVLGLAVYNRYLKRVALWGNLTVSALGSLAFLYGGGAVHALHAAAWPAAFAFVFHLGREILKDLEDASGDRLLSGSTVPLRWGPRAARALITGLFALLMGLVLLPVATGAFGARYLVLVSLLDGLVLYVLVALWRSRTPRALRRLSHLLKAGMVLGLAAFFFDRL